MAEPHSLTFARTQTEFSATLQKRVNAYFKQNNIKRHGNSEMIFKSIFMFTLYFGPYMLILSGLITNPWLMLIPVFVMGFGLAGIGLSVMHDANHGAYSDKAWINSLMGYSINLIGANAFAWKIQHNVLHHTYTNVHEHDEDISPRGVLRLSPHSSWKSIHKFQHIYAWFLYGLMTIVWLGIKDYVRLIRYHRDGTAKKQKANIVREWVILIISKLTYVGYIYFIPLLLTPLLWWQVLIGILLMHYMAGFILAIIFSGCDRQTLAGEAIVNYVSELTVTTAGDVSVCEGGDVTLEASGAPEGGFYKWFDGNGTLIAGATTASLTVSDVETESVYYVTSAHPNGCESDRAEIHVYADTLDTPVIRMDKDTLYTDAVGYYQWKKDGSEIPGATLPYYAPAESGTYSVVASNGACIKESTSFAFTADSDGDGDGGDGDGGNGDGGDGNGDGGDGDGGDGNGDGGDGDGDPITGIDNGNNSEFVLNIYPMPTTGSRISVLLRSPKTDPVMIEVIDALGRLHFKKMFDAQTLMQGTDIVPASSLYNGIYFIRATQADIRARKKIIVNN